LEFGLTHHVTTFDFRHYIGNIFCRAHVMKTVFYHQGNKCLFFVVLVRIKRTGGVYFDFVAR